MNIQFQLNPVHHQSVVVGSSRVDPIGPQRTKYQFQAHQKGTQDDESTHFEEREAELRTEGSVSTVGSDHGQSKASEIFKERMKQANANQWRLVSSNERNDFYNPQVLAPLSQDIYLNMKKEEIGKMVPVDYLQTVQTEIKDTSRAFLIEWVIDVHRKFRLTPEALYVAIFVIDQFMSRKRMLKSQLHLLGVATLLIASKYEEIYPPSLRDFLAVCENKFNKELVI